VQLTRRVVLLAGPLALLPEHVFAAPAPRAARTVDPTGTTLERTLTRGAPVNAGGYCHHSISPGEPHVVRSELAAARPGRAGTRVGMAAFAHLTDIHLVDAQSPARVEWIDRYNDGPTSSLVFNAAYRPGEMLSAQVADSIVRAVSAVHRAPVTGVEVTFALVTGDTVDNCQANELRWAIDLLDGQTVRPDSGDLTRWEGVHDSEASSYDEHYWHPDAGPDQAKGAYGFPTVPGLLNAARRPFRAVGLPMRWYAVYGNHDGLIQGNLPPSTVPLTAAATGPVKIVGAPAGLSPADVERGLATMDPTVLSALATAPVRMVTADAGRVITSRAQTIEAHFHTTGSPVGHGFTERNRTDSTAYYAVDEGALRILVMDTVNPNGYADGSLDTTQLAWLLAMLDSAPKRLTVITSHHTADTMTNPLVGTGGDPAQRVQGPQVVAALLARPQVVLWVNGHTHVNRVTPRRRDGGGGFWEVTTASHIDWPQQARIIEVVDNRDTTLSLFATVIDAAAGAAFGGLDTTSSLASLARELALNDWQERARPDPLLDGRRGLRSDRNVELLVPAPFRLDPLDPTSSAGTRPTGGTRPKPARRAGAPTRPTPSLASTGPDALTLMVGAAALGSAAVLHRRPPGPADGQE
jgi:metallophosphoesterase (TIGR03767 family)